jgi:hypothetical protein
MGARLCLKARRRGCLAAGRRTTVLRRRSKNLDLDRRVALSRFFAPYLQQVRGTDDTTATRSIPVLADKLLAAELLGNVSIRTVDRLRAVGEIESVLVGERSVRITVASIERYLSRQLPTSPLDSGTAEIEEADPYAIPLLLELKAAAVERRARAAA